ncbi:type IX secretion system sortase PorU [Echinicola marina]|uniref:type IX secretion system sortase PorU n=1 Tax=Echinicola marina TaxID=2859768 RepID=UPI001CF623AC|nr:type IX secretion system sortase PorU [Echinicola marina]UCS91892.1 type IX secretion system sortase PorU [Echinicola marina]
MKFNPNIAFLYLLTSLILCCQSITLHAQSSYFKIPINKSGIYKISQSDLQQFGASQIDQISIYGRKGMLPQKLAPSELELQEIPTKIVNDQLFVFLEGPHSLGISADSIHYQHHFYSDTAFYLIKTNNEQPKRIENKDYSSPTVKQEFLYQIYAYKEATQNLLSSGRKWYSNRLFNGGISSFNIDIPSYDQGPLYYQARVMAQSLSNSTLSIRTGTNTFSQIDIPSVPNSTYGLKGREGFDHGFIAHTELGNISSFNLEMKGNDNGIGFLDYFLLGLPFDTQQLEDGIYFALGNPAISIKLRENLHYWDVTDFHQPAIIKSQGNKISLPQGRIMAVFNPEQVQNIPLPENIDLSARNHQGKAELIIIAAPSLLYQSERLAEHKMKKGISCQIITPQEIYDAYNYGTRDITAIRNFLADQYHTSGQLKNVLLMGKGTFDYKNIIDGRPNLVPTYSSRNSLNPLTSYSSDDYFGFLKFGQGDWLENETGDEVLSIGIGRLPVINPQEAKNIVDKIIHYENTALQLGNWKSKLLFLADDGDNNIHLKHSEAHIERIREEHPEFMTEQLYLDDFKQLQEGDYQSAPAAKAALTEKLEEGVLLLNYIGHGNENTLMAERIYQTSDLQNWPESKHYPIFITATCEFGRHDSPFIRSGAEELLMGQKKGAIALLTTGRPVFSSINFDLNKAFIAALFSQKNGQYLSLGEIFKITKNNSLNGPYNRNFSLLGDPSLRLALPDLAIQTAIEAAEITITADSLKAGNKALIKGKVIDPLTGAWMQHFKGEFHLTILDKPIEVETLGDEGPTIKYTKDNNSLFRGTGEIIAGEFELEVLISPQIHQNFEKGKIRIFAIDSQSKLEAFGAKSVLLGGKPEAATDDSSGPIIRLFAEDSLRDIHTISSTQIRLLARLKDESGIQISNHPEGQNISLKVNGNAAIDISKYYHSINSSFKEGFIDTTVKGLQEGINILELTAYDQLGNSSTESLVITVEGSNHLKILDHKTYPNPTNSISHFYIRHNRPDENINLQLNIYNMMGSIIYSTAERLIKADPEIKDLEWIFLRDITKIPAKGTYIYKLQLFSEADGTSDQAIGKINIQ